MCPRSGCTPFVIDFWKRGGKGLNVTVPHKIKARQPGREMSQRAARAGAVNTLLMDAHGITGDNTDGAGLVRDLTQNLKVCPQRVAHPAGGLRWRRARLSWVRCWMSRPPYWSSPGAPRERADARSVSLKLSARWPAAGLDAVPADGST